MLKDPPQCENHGNVYLHMRVMRTALDLSMSETSAGWVMIVRVFEADVCVEV